MTYTPEHNPAENRRMAEIIGRHLENGAILLVAITGTSKTNMSYRLKVSLAYESEAGGLDVIYLNYWLAQALKKNLTAENEIRFSGCGFDRVHDVAYTIAEILRGYGFAFSLQKMPRFVRVA